MKINDIIWCEKDIILIPHQHMVFLFEAQVSRMKDSQMWETAVFRRMHFATSYLPPDIPHYWDIIATFANQGNPESSSMSPESVRILMENIQIMNTKAFCLDVDLIRELITMKYGPAKQY